MSINEFSALVQSQIFKDWLGKLESNLLTTTVEQIRTREQRAEKTDFAISTQQIKNMYKSVTNRKLTNAKAKTILRNIAKMANRDYPSVAARIGRSSGLVFENIGFDTITKYVRTVFDELDGVQEAYQAAQDKYIAEKKREILSKRKRTITAFGQPTAIDPNSPLTREEQKTLDDAVSKKNFGFGSFLHKGHVVSIATNSAKAVRESLQEAQEFDREQRELLTGVLDKYIEKLQKDDLASANLPNAINQKIYAKYVKSHNKYLVEIQLSYDNLTSGSTSLPIVNELRSVFTSSEADLVSIMRKSPTLGSKLLTSKGSPSYLDLLAQSLLHTLDPKNHKAPKTYRVSPTLVASNSIPIKNKKPNKKAIEELKKTKAKLKASPKLKIAKELQETEKVSDIGLDLNTLLAYLNAEIVDAIKRNMGDGARSDILNLRTGRFAESVQVTRLSKSRAGMITAFYTYMRNPYGTFSEGGRQEVPHSRDPKLLISKSIRELAQEQVSNRLRAVLV